VTFSPDDRAVLGSVLFAAAVVLSWHMERTWWTAVKVSIGAAWANSVGRWFARRRMRSNVIASWDDCA
jgi:uncharacterized membrane protein